MQITHSKPYFILSLCVILIQNTLFNQKNSLFTVKIDFIQKNLKYHRLKTIKYKRNKSHVKV